MPKLTKTFIGKLPFPASGQRLIRDEELPGFALRLTPGSRSWILFYRFQGKRRSITLGSYYALSPDTAKTAAKGLLSDIAMGVDPLDVNWRIVLPVFWRIIWQLAKQTCQQFLKSGSTL